MADDGLGDKVKGNVEEFAGKLTGDKDLEAEGRVNKAEGDIKDAVGDIKANAEAVVNKVKEKLD